MNRTITLMLAAGALLTCEQASAQILDLSWRTIDSGGGTSEAEGYSLSGAIAQPDAGELTGVGYELTGGFWTIPASSESCYANCDASTTSPVLNIQDFVCFLNRFAAGEAIANCDGSTNPPTLNVGDFVCFLNRFAAGCSGS